MSGHAILSDNVRDSSFLSQNPFSFFYYFLHIFSPFSPDILHTVIWQEGSSPMSSDSELLSEGGEEDEDEEGDVRGNRMGRSGRAMDYSDGEDSVSRPDSADDF